MRTVAILALLALAGCGVDGPPVPPPAKEPPASGVSVSGTVEFGVTGRG